MNTPTKSLFLSIILFTLLTQQSPAQTSDDFALPPPPSIPDLIATLDSDNILAHINILSTDIGVRPAGSESECLSMEYIDSQFQDFGYETYTDTFNIGNGLSSSNIWAKLDGYYPDIILIGAHYDSKSPSPGANDNASGVAVMLELAHVMKDSVPPYTIMFVAFGSEEMIDSNPDHHHYGSRFMASDPELISHLHSMVSIDMCGVGSDLYIHNLGIADNSWRDYMGGIADEMGLPVHIGIDSPFSDHEAFEHAGVPVAWVHWRTDNDYHTERDTMDRIQPELLLQTAELVIRSVYEIETPYPVL